MLYMKRATVIGTARQQVAILPMLTFILYIIIVLELKIYYSKTRSRCFLGMCQVQVPGEILIS